MRRMGIVLTVAAAVWTATPVLAVTLSGEACTVNTTVDNVTVGVGAGPGGAVVCVDDNGSHHRAEVDTATALERDTWTIVSVGGGANACVFSDYACMTTGGTVFATAYDDTVAPIVYLPSLCTEHVQPYYSRCAMVMTGGRVDGTAVPRAYVYVCEDLDDAKGFACTSPVDELQRAVTPGLDKNTEPVTVSH